MGGLQGAFAKVTSPTLRGDRGQGGAERSGLSADQVDEVIMGCVLPAGLGQAPARQAALGAGLTAERTLRYRQQDVRFRHEGGDAGL
jgi:acetyl-CoA C-acetyltransferase